MSTKSVAQTLIESAVSYEDVLLGHLTPNPNVILATLIDSLTKHGLSATVSPHEDTGAYHVQVIANKPMTDEQRQVAKTHLSTLGKFVPDIPGGSISNNTDAFGYPAANPTAQ